MTDDHRAKMERNQAIADAADRDRAQALDHIRLYAAALAGRPPKLKAKSKKRRS